MLVLGIETSCDETAAAVARKDRNRIKILSNVVASQIKLHRRYGGVVPEVAAREHVSAILPVIEKALIKAGISRRRAKSKLGAIAVTTGPGLITSLLVGVETARTLAAVWEMPVISVNHIEAHIFAAFIGRNLEKIKFPALALTVSGGHTMLVELKDFSHWLIIGDTRDDAAGEAFDKAAQLLGLNYPGGPAIAKAAQKFNLSSSLPALPRPMLNAPNLDFSFSGLKTALLYALQKDKNWQKRVPAYAYAFQQAVIDVLAGKTLKAARRLNARTVILTGGVAANRELRCQLAEGVQQLDQGVEFVLPALAYTTDNAAMVAAAGCLKKDKALRWNSLKADPVAGLLGG